jgi:hypothetical protein
VYWKVADRQRDVAYVDTGANLVVPAVTYSMTNFRMKALSCAPPQAYIDGMAKAASSEKGLPLDIQTFTVLRHNVDNVGRGLTHALIPSLHTRCRSVIIHPLSTEAYRDLGQESFRGVFDAAQEYQFNLGSEVMPSRNVDLKRYGLDPVRTEPIHLHELEKTISAAGIPCRSLHGAGHNFLIGRAFARYGQTADVSQETLSAKVRYGGATLQKIYNSIIYHLVRINISRGGVIATI